MKRTTLCRFKTLLSSSALRYSVSLQPRSKVANLVDRLTACLRWQMPRTRTRFVIFMSPRASGLISDLQLACRRSRRSWNITTIFSLTRMKRLERRFYANSLCSNFIRSLFTHCPFALFRYPLSTPCIFYWEWLLYSMVLGLLVSQPISLSFAVPSGTRANHRSNSCLTCCTMVIIVVNMYSSYHNDFCVTIT